MPVLVVVRVLATKQVLVLTPRAALLVLPVPISSRRDGRFAGLVRSSGPWMNEVHKRYQDVRTVLGDLVKASILALPFLFAVE